ncbi:MAG: MmgE/PrpD family protein [Pedobacter sp.]|nr:MAG: MmgE/PrpD family protein [Pedobacter sp.]
MDNDNQINITEQFINDIYELSLSSFDEVILKEAKKCIVDYLGVTLAGAKMLNSQSLQLLNALEPPTPQVSVLGLSTFASIQSSALLNGMHAHVAELDDGERFGMFHPGAPILSALLPLAQSRKLSGLSLLKGLIIGYEAAIRVARSLQPAMKDRGYHGTGTCGAIGAAIGTAIMLDFTKDQLKTALSAAATSAGGILKVIKDVSTLKPFNSGKAAQNGLVATLITEAGFMGPHDVLGGALGFLNVMVDKPNLKELSGQGLGRLAIFGVYKKPYAACRHCHPAIEAALAINSSQKITVDQIDAIEVKTYQWGVAGHEHTDITSVNSAKMSTPFSVAVAMVEKSAGMNEFTEDKISNETILGLTRKVVVNSEESFSKLFPQKRVAQVEVLLTDGRRFEHIVELPKGEPENPISDQELEDKFISLALYSGKSEDQCAQILKATWNIEHDLDKLYPLL